ncbi:metallophosphoesterase [Kurthia sibirica]|uniref:Phosphoesterase n=1 Tax=Kurthia sibirica TaxID=202750 RepID=A0A2U3ALQ8_9BACL|nr:metallophosphoesterase [Kurthia sibirica]PWI25471.1 phosphoesterase [Kurthia sibirica]GEK33947.1 phosphoesterase [Kurthia sibirica]
MSLKAIVLVIVAICLYSAITFYIGWNLRKLLLQFGLKRFALFYWIVLYVISFSFILARFIHIDALHVIGQYWMFFLIYGLIMSIVANLVSFIVRYRYTKVIGLSAISIIMLLFVWGTYNAFSPVVIHQTINSHEKSTKKQVKLVIASDLHLGILSNKKHLENFVKLSNEQKPDIVILAGDIVDDIPKWFIEQKMGDTMKQLQAKDGVYAVLGNHEYIGDELKEVEKVLKEANIKVLKDQSTVIDDAITITGRDDATNKDRKQLAQLQEDVATDKPWLVFDHQPSETLKDPEVDLYVSGHTHKGQIWPGNLMTKMIYPLDYGHKSVNGTDYIVTSGYGFWGPPMRIGTRSELWAVTMNFK